MASQKTHSQTMPIRFEVVEEIAKKLESLTPQQRVFAEYLLPSPESLAFLSITDLAKEAGVSEATIVRFCHALGYEGYASLSREIQQTIQVELGTVGRFRLVREMRRESAEVVPASNFERVVNFEIENLVRLSKSVKTEEFYRCIKMMADADRIVIVGCLSSNSLATYFGQALSKIVNQVDIVTGYDVLTSAVLQGLTRNSLAFLISFPRYPKMTVALGRLAALQGAQLVAITNSHISPVVPLADLSFTLQVGIPSFVDAYASPVVFINALLTELSEQHPNSSQQALMGYDAYAEQMDLFELSKARLKK